MKFGSLFTGIGGFDLGFHNSGMKCVWQVEIDNQCNKILKRHYKGVERFKDVKECGTHNLRAVDLICGGFPCQDLSIAGKREGLAGERSGLWFEFARVIDELEPQWVVIENVPGLLSSDRGKDFAVIVRWLAERGYGVAWRVFDAQYFGVPQRRRRVFVVGSLGDGRAAEVLFESESSPWDTAPSKEKGQGITSYAIRRAQTSSNGWGIDDKVTHALDNSGGDAVMVANTLAGGSSKCHSDISSGQQDSNLVVSYSPFSHYDWKEAEQAATLQNGNHRLSGSENLIAFNARRTELGTLDDLSPTLNPGGGGFQSPGISNIQGVRRLTPLECERLQGFPDGWTEGQSDTVRYRQLGNAVAVPVIEWIGKRIMEANE